MDEPASRARRRTRIALLAAALFAAGLAADPLAERGVAVTGGAAPGYVDDRLCGRCHTDLYQAYQEVGMARSFYRPRPETDIEDFEHNHYFHPPSGRHYEMIRSGDRLVMKRYQLDADGEPIHVLEQPVDWILGSGSHSRTYLYRTPGGELYQLPIAWYSQTATWGMAPGYDRPDHLGITRWVRRECMFCHNAYPDVPAASDAYGAPPVYPEELPEGIGCQRCHGPGAEHTAIAMREPVDFERLAAAIVNPGKLEPRLRDDVCYGCHMQPSVALPGVRRFGRGDYSFRPGEPLADYLVQVDVEEEGKARGERFEINHHPYRLEQSRCFTASGGRLSCLTCHDPHRKVPAADRATHYRAACLGCHDLDDCGSPSGIPEMMAGGPAGTDPGDCVACHMQERRTHDVVRVTMTDHRIRRRPGGEDLLAPLAESEPVLVDVEIMDRERRPAGALGEVYRAAAVVRAGGGAGALDHLAKALAAARPREIDPYLDLARGQIRLRRIPQAELALGALLALYPDAATGWMWRGITEDARGRREAALGALRRALEIRPELVEAHYNLGLLLRGYGHPEEAVASLERALAARPNMAAAWFQLAKAQADLGRPQEAAAALRRVLEIDPAHHDASLTLRESLPVEPRRPAAKAMPPPKELHQHDQAPATTAGPPPSPGGV